MCSYLSNILNLVNFSKHMEILCFSIHSCLVKKKNIQIIQIILPVLKWGLGGFLGVGYISDMII